MHERTGLFRQTLLLNWPMGPFLLMGPFALEKSRADIPTKESINSGRNISFEKIFLAVLFRKA